MSRAKAIKIERLGDYPLDKPGMFLRAERRHWPDGTSCLHIAKWGTPSTQARPMPWWPPQYTQILWPLAPGFLRELLEALDGQGAGQSGLLARETEAG
jgi:hypothetical protein